MYYILTQKAIFLNIFRTVLTVQTINIVITVEIIRKNHYNELGSDFSDGKE